MYEFKKVKKFMVLGLVVFFVFPLLFRAQFRPHRTVKTDLVVKLICRGFNPM